MLTAVSVAAMSASLFLVSHYDTASHSRAEPQWQSLSVDELIDQLVHVGPEGFGLDDRSVHCMGFFVATDSLAECSALVSSFEAPPAFRELVRRGAAALPDLLAHVRDGRRTQLCLRTFREGETWADVADDAPAVGPFAAIIFDQEYSPRRRSSCDPRTPPNDTPASTFTDALDLGDGARFPDSYTVRVGDLCYTAIGQIVNRPLDSVVYGGENCINMSSPVEDPVLASAVRRDWSGLSADAHYQSLVADAYDPGLGSAWWAVGALKRLRFYFPDRAEQVLVSLLARRIYSWSAEIDFAESDLIDSGNESEWRSRYTQIRRNYGVIGTSAAILLLKQHLEEVCRSIHFLRRPGNSIGGSSVGDSPEDFERRYEKTRRLLEVLHSEGVPLLPPEELVDVWQHIEILAATNAFKSSNVDRAVYESVMRTRTAGNLDGWELQALIEASIERLAGTHYEDHLREFLKEHQPPAGAESAP